MEDYLRQFRLGPHTQGLAWLDCGSGADGLDREWDLGPDGAHGLSEQERDAVRFRVAQGITGRPGDTSRRAGSGGRRRRSTRRSRGGSCWARRSARRPPAPGAGEDYTYGRPSRRSAGVPGVVLPSLRRRPPRVCVVIDTSGSVSDAELGSALLEVAAIARAVGGRRDLVTVLPCDAAARVAHPLCRAEGIPLVGGGGTDLRTGFARALRPEPRPDVIVVLTDGQTPWPRHTAPVPDGGGAVPPDKPDRDEDDPDYVPDAPPDWARVVDIG